MAIFNSFLYVYQRVDGSRRSGILTSLSGGYSARQTTSLAECWEDHPMGGTAWILREFPLRFSIRESLDIGTGHPKQLPSCTLWLCQNSYWKWPSRNSGFSHWKWWFSIVMLVYQRVLDIGNSRYSSIPALVIGLQSPSKVSWMIPRFGYQSVQFSGF